MVLKVLKKVQIKILKGFKRAKTNVLNLFFDF